MERHPRRWLILIVLCLSLMVLVIDNTVLNVAIPPLVRDLGASAQDIQWIIDAYILVFAGLLLTAGAMSDRYGRRRALIAGLVIFGGASFVATLATSPGQLIAARALMGVGGAILMPSTLSILITVFDDTERRKAIAAWSAVAMIGFVAGPLVGGALIEQFGWPSVFLINVPIAALAIIAAVLLMPESRGPQRAPDPLGAILSMTGMTALVWMIIVIPRDGWGSAGTLVAGGVAAVALTTFAIWESRVPHPMVPIRLFRDRNFSGASFSIVLLAFSSGGLMLILTQYIQFVLGFTPRETGLLFIPMALTVATVNGLGATLGQKIGNRPMMVAGFLVIAAGFGWMATIGPGDGVGKLIAGLVVMGIGSGLVAPSAVATLMGAVPREHAGVGSALNDTVQQSGAALSVAILGSVLAAGFTSAMPSSAPEPARRSIGEALAVAARTGDAGLAAVARDAFATAMSVGFVVGVAGAIAAAVLSLLVVRDRTAGAGEATEETVAAVDAS